MASWGVTAINHNNIVCIPDSCRQSIQESAYSQYAQGCGASAGPAWGTGCNSTPGPRPGYPPVSCSSPGSHWGLKYKRIIKIN